MRYFLDYLEQGGISWEAFRTRGARGGLFAMVAVLLPGRTALVLAPSLAAADCAPSDYVALSGSALRELARHKLHYAQALLDPHAGREAELLCEGGFTRLTSLIYLEREVVYPWSPPPSSQEVQWLDLTQRSDEQLGALLEASYEETLDCPELVGARSIADVIASHRASGSYDPRLWQVARIDGVDAGCVLLSPHQALSSCEIVYLGVRLGFRRRGVGSLLLRRAVDLARQRRLGRLHVAMDERNVAAAAAYARFAFRESGRRIALLHRFSGDRGV